MRILLYVFANMIVTLSSVLAVSKTKLFSISDKILYFFIFFLCQIILSEIFLGFFLKRLFHYPLIFLNLLVLIILVFTAKLRNLKNEAKFFCVRIKRIFKIIFKTPILAILQVLIVMQILYIFFIGYNFPPYGWDEIWYHLTTAASWLQEGKIFNLPVPSIWNDSQYIASLSSYTKAYHMSVLGLWHNVYPMNTELISMWNIIFLGDDTLVDLTQLPFSIISMICIYSTGRKVGLQRKSAILAGQLFFFTPILIIQSRTAYVDITFSILTLICINFLIGLIKYKYQVYANLCAISCGILMGIKYSGAVFAIFFILCIFYLQFRNQGYFIAVKSTILNVCLVLVLGGFWYVRNLYFYNNPMYPFTIKAGEYIVFNGLGSVHELIMKHNIPPENLNAGYIKKLMNSWLETEKYYSVDMRKAGFGPIWTIFGISSIILAFLRNIHRPRKLFLLFEGIILLLFILHPTNWWTRYTLFIVALGSISISLLLKRSNKIQKYILSAAIIFLCIYTIAITNAYLIPVNIKSALDMPKYQRTIGGTLYSDYKWVDKINGAKVGYAPMPFAYILFGCDFRNKVYLIDGNSKEEWIENILKNKIEYITFLKDYLYYEEWILEYQHIFEKIFEGKTLQVYKTKL